MVLVMVIIFIALAIYARKIEPRWIEVTQHTVYVKGLPKNLEGMTVVQLSDLHRGRKVSDSLIKRAISITQKQSPDIVVITGDFVSRGPENASKCADMLSVLKPRLGTYAVLGNHDYWNGKNKVMQALRAENIIVLNNQNMQIAPGLYMIGIEDLWAGHPDAKKAWAGVDPDAAQIVLSHSPRGVKLFSNHNCLALTGHTHGGEFKIPLIPRSKLPGLRGWEYIQGWYRVGNVNMYVNRGIGLVNPLRIRFLSRPEVSVFKLTASKDADRQK